MNTTTKKYAIILSLLLVLLCLGSIIYLICFPNSKTTDYTASIYVQGQLYKEIPLSQVTTPYELTIPCETGGYNIICVEPGAISMGAADCPDKLCVKQGSITNALLPITCLPHNVVIELKPTETVLNNTPDMITH